MDSAGGLPINCTLKGKQLLSKPIGTAIEGNQVALATGKGATKEEILEKVYNGLK